MKSLDGRSASRRKKGRVPRPPLPDLQNLSAEQQSVLEAIVRGPRGRLDDPLAVWLQSPELADLAQKLGAFCRYGTSLEPSLSEFLILCVAEHWQAGLEWAIHAPIACEAGLKESVLASLAQGEEPEFADARFATAYRFAKELLETKAVSPTAYEDAITELGTRGVVEMVGILGYYSLISMTIKAFAIPVPAQCKDPFPARRLQTRQQDQQPSVRKSSASRETY